MSEFFIKRGEKVQGPLNLATVKRLADAGKLRESDLIARSKSGVFTEITHYFKLSQNQGGASSKSTTNSSGSDPAVSNQNDVTANQIPTPVGHKATDQLRQKTVSNKSASTPPQANIDTYKAKASRPPPQPKSTTPSPTTKTPSLMELEVPGSPPAEPKDKLHNETEILLAEIAPDHFETTTNRNPSHLNNPEHHFSTPIPSPAGPNQKISASGPNLIYCTDCGKQVSRRAKICPHCGLSVGDIIQDSAYSEQSFIDPPPDASIASPVIPHLVQLDSNQYAIRGLTVSIAFDCALEACERNHVVEESYPDGGIIRGLGFSGLNFQVQIFQQQDAVMLSINTEAEEPVNTFKKAGVNALNFVADNWVTLAQGKIPIIPNNQNRKSDFESMAHLDGETDEWLLRRNILWSLGMRHLVYTELKPDINPTGKSAFIEPYLRRIGPHLIEIAAPQLDILTIIGTACSVDSAENFRTAFSGLTQQDVSEIKELYCKITDVNINYPVVHAEANPGRFRNNQLVSFCTYWTKSFKTAVAIECRSVSHFDRKNEQKLAQRLSSILEIVFSRLPNDFR